MDFDDDGLRDIWTNESDAIGSVGNYFARHGWVADGLVAQRVTVDGTAADRVANESLKPKRTVGELRELGLAVDGLTAMEMASLYRMALENGTEYWLGLNNFYVITRYNRSRLYALAVFQLSQEILAGRRENLSQAE